MQLLFVGVKGTGLSPEERELFRRIKPAGYILFARNIETCEQTRALTDELAALNDFCPLLAIDQEGGRVVRTRALGIEAPSAGQLSAAGNQTDIKWHAWWTAQTLRQLGFNMNFAPVLDIASAGTVAGALTGRCWGSDSNSVSSHAGTYASALLKNGILTCGKHFPGLGRAETDPHFELPVVDASLDDLLRRDIIPFTSLGDKCLSAVMCAHVFFPRLDSETPSSLSRRILVDLLRNQLGYEGLVIPDDLDMGAIVSRYGLPEACSLAIEAGNDLAMVCHSIDRVEECSAAVDLLPEPLLNERKNRVSDFLWKKVPGRSPFSADLWEKASQGSREFYEKFRGGETDAASCSPVENY